MRPATLLSIALLGLLCEAAPSLAVPPAKPAAPTQAQPQRPNPVDPDDDDGLAPTAAPTAARSGGTLARAGERRRRSYASCNRESHKRNLGGGARRRFLVRCKLGYERRQPSASPAAPPQPQGKRP